MATCCQEPADAWVLPPTQGDTGLQGAEVLLAAMK